MNVIEGVRSVLITSQIRVYNVFRIRQLHLPTLTKQGGVLKTLAILEMVV